MHQRRALDEARDQVAALGLPNPVSLLLFSSTRDTGLDAARAQIASWLEPPEGVEHVRAAPGHGVPGQSDPEPATGPAQLRGEA